MVAETLTRGSLNVRIERGGRPEVKNLMLAPKQFDQLNRDLEIRDLYNMEDAFSLGESYTNAYRARLDANLAFWDSLDGKVDWPADAGRHPLTEVVLQDFLVVDVSKPYQEQGGFFEIELAGLRGEPHLTCGGRALNDDVMDTIFTQLVTAGVGPAIRDGVDGATRAGNGPLSVPRRAQPGPAHATGAPPLTWHTMTAPTAARWRPRRWSSTTSSPACCRSARRRTSAPTCCCASTTAPTGASWCAGCTG